MKLVDWILGLFGKQKDEINPKELDAWPFPVVLGTPPAIKKAPAKKKRGRPALKKPAVIAKTVAKKKATKKVK